MKKVMPPQPLSVQSLHVKKWQDNFTVSLFNGLSSQLATDLSITSHQQKQRFSIYQNNVFYSLTESLSNLYPVVKKLVGEDFFNACASVYLHKHPTKQAAMVFFGETFPTFLANFKHTQDMPYLVDVAQLELYRHKAYHADDAPAMMPIDFESIDEVTFENTSWQLHPSVKLIDSIFPIFSIWQSNQEDNSPKEINLNEPEAIIIVRNEYELLIFNVDQGTYRFYHALIAQMSVHDAALYGLETNGFNVSAAIALGIQNGFFVKFK